MKMRAPASCGPTREIALLIADPTPELRTRTDVMSAVVRGATIIVRPTPKMSEPGRKSTREERVGTDVRGSAGCRRHGALVAGTREYHRTRTAMIAGPVAMNHLGP